MSFEEFVEQWTGRDIEYHTRNKTSGLEFARAAWETATNAERTRQLRPAHCERAPNPWRTNEN